MRNKGEERVWVGEGYLLGHLSWEDGVMYGDAEGGG